MNKLFRFAKVIARSIYKPAQKTLYRIPQIKQVLNDDHRQKSQFNTLAFQNHLQLIQVQNQEQIKQKFQVGLSELAKINAQLLKQTNYVRFAGDFSPCVNPEQFIHALQIYRQGALAQFYSIDDLETINSVYQSDSEFEFQDSQIL
ncbi:unnamed protein product (macronuclear) [Paramecium tetraurelia]|uniref:Uncharacterized protein n=1 Tax=Paramecium tetraurelia TaxID=5888 RepID=A0E780_PARTE|nr:uncharacterized protein GSPATT00023875001 [Paramecium tetraurelia]CAK91147.1 unnamed protein product [Paramecium tetraurelia]|eukprot:XP_001458544.1 hypothetical protein (macronuclear) [Paramecium tetraurelia strain d4-2]